MSSFSRLHDVKVAVTSLTKDIKYHANYFIVRFVLAKSHRNAGQVNLQGKKYKLLRCKCCSVEDLRDSLEAKRIKKEIRAILV